MSAASSCVSVVFSSALARLAWSQGDTGLKGAESALIQRAGGKRTVPRDLPEDHTVDVHLRRVKKKKKFIWHQANYEIIELHAAVCAH